jgi:flagellar basal-body rod protein FlgC
MDNLISIAASGLTANRARLGVVADNLANANSTGYQDLVVELAAAPTPTGGPDAGIGAGVEVTGIVPLAAPALPGITSTGANGASQPQVSEVQNLTDLVDAQSAYAANATAFSAAKTLDTKALAL